MPLVRLKPTELSEQLRNQLASLHLRIYGDISFARNLRFRGPVNIGRNCLAFRMQIDAYTEVSSDTMMATSKLGRYCSVCHRVDMSMGNHIMTYPTTSNSFFNNHAFMHYSGEIKKASPAMVAQGGDTSQIEIGHDVCIGAHVKFAKSVQVGHGAVIGTGTVVTKDIPPYAIVAGGGSSGSQRILRYRFSDEIISDLLELNWWDYDVPRMIASGVEVPSTDVKDFIAFFKNEDREKLLQLCEPWLLVCVPDPETAYVFPSESDSFMDFNCVEVNDEGQAVRAFLQR